MNVGVGQPFDILPEHQHLYASQHAAEKIADRKPQVDADIADEPLGERSMEAVPDGNGEGDRPQYREDDQEERADGVYHEGCRLEHRSSNSRKNACTDRFMLYIARSMYIPHASMASSTPSSSSRLSNSSLSTR